MNPRLKHSVDTDDWAAVAKNITEEVIEEYLPDAKQDLAAGKPLEEVVSSLTEDVREFTGERLLNHIDSTGMMYHKTRYAYCPSLGGYRKRYYPLSASDVPDELLDVDALVPDLEDLVRRALIQATVERTLGEGTYLSLTREDFEQICPAPGKVIHVTAGDADEAVKLLRVEIDRAGISQPAGAIMLIQSTSLTMADLKKIDSAVPHADRFKRGLSFLKPDECEVEIWIFA